MSNYNSKTSYDFLTAFPDPTIVFGTRNKHAVYSYRVHHKNIFKGNPPQLIPTIPTTILPSSMPCIDNPDLNIFETTNS
jgi:hypothetical protein